MSRTFRKREVTWTSPRDTQGKRAKQALQKEIDEDLDCPWCSGCPGCKCGLHIRPEEAKNAS